MEQKNASPLKRTIKTTRPRLRTWNSSLTGLQGYSREQEAAKRKLAAEREFNEKFNKVQRFSGLTKQKSTNRAANWSFACEAFSSRWDRRP
jgi:hypothetical protein